MLFSFLVEFSDNFACIVSVNCFFFFVKQLISQAIQARLKRNAKVTTIDFFELLSLVRKREKKVASNCNSRPVLFFLVDLVLAQILHVKWTITVRRKKLFGNASAFFCSVDTITQLSSFFC